jgi:hypothetical protein
MKIGHGSDSGIEGFRNWGIEGLKDNINKLKQIEFLQFLNSQPGLTGKNSHKGTKTQRKNVYYN